MDNSARKHQDFAFFWPFQVDRCSYFIFAITNSKKGLFLMFMVVSYSSGSIMLLTSFLKYQLGRRLRNNLWRTLLTATSMSSGNSLLLYRTNQAMRLDPKTWWCQAERKQRPQKQSMIFVMKAYFSQTLLALRSEPWTRNILALNISESSQSWSAILLQINSQRNYWTAIFEKFWMCVSKMIWFQSLSNPNLYCYALSWIYRRIKSY